MLAGLLQFLTYGTVGLGLALAVLAYGLLRAEQNIATPRPQIMMAIYVFMAFSLLLASGGFALEYLRVPRIVPHEETWPGKIPRLFPLGDAISCVKVSEQQNYSGSTCSVSKINGAWTMTLDNPTDLETITCQAACIER